MRPFCAICLAAVAAAISFAAPAALTANAASAPLVTLFYGGAEYVCREDYPEPPDFLTGEEYARRGLDRPVRERLAVADKLISEGSDVKRALIYCFPALEDTVGEAMSSVRKVPVDAEIRFSPDKSPMFEISRSVPGYSLREMRVYSDIYFALRRGSKRVMLSPEADLPAVTAERLAACTRLRSRFSMSRINGRTLMPGESFAFNKTVGRRTEENGFRRAKIIVGGQYTDGVGGGVCQASTTLYNAALLAGMKVTAVSRHSLVPSYVDPSFDAMVNGSGSDLKFVNAGEDPVFIRAVATNGKATAEFYSSELPYKVQLKSVIVKTGERPADTEFVDTERRYTEGMEAGEKIRVSGGAPAVTSEGYVIKVYPDGRCEQTRIRRDEYSPAAGRIAVAPD